MGLSESSRQILFIRSFLDCLIPFVSTQAFARPRTISSGSMSSPSVALLIVASTAWMSSLVVATSPSHSTGVPSETIWVSAPTTFQTAAWTRWSERTSARKVFSSGSFLPVNLSKKLGTVIDTVYSYRETVNSGWLSELRVDAAGTRT